MVDAKWSISLLPPVCSLDLKHFVFKSLAGAEHSLFYMCVPTYNILCVTFNGKQSESQSHETMAIENRKFHLNIIYIEWLLAWFKFIQLIQLDKSIFNFDWKCVESANIAVWMRGECVCAMMCDFVSQKGCTNETNMTNMGLYDSIIRITMNILDFKLNCNSFDGNSS